MDVSWFESLKTDVNGQLSAAAYHRLSECASQADEGIMVDVGAAQGATSISIGVGIKQPKTTTLYSIDRCHGSRALPSLSRVDQESNLATLKNHLQQYGVLGHTRVLCGALSDVAQDIPADREITLLCIDADGCIDRDMRLLYDRLAPGAHLIFDDYHDRINSHGQRLLDYTASELENYEAHSRKCQKWAAHQSVSDHTPLGKDYSIVRFVDQLVTSGCLTKSCVLDGVWFGQKPVDAASLDTEALQLVRREINEKFFAMRNEPVR